MLPGCLHFPARSTRLMTARQADGRWPTLLSRCQDRVSSSPPATSGDQSWSPATCPDRWGETFSNNVVAAAMIDWLVHHADVLTLTGDSYRTRQRRELLAKENRTSRDQATIQRVKFPGTRVLVLVATRVIDEGAC